MTDENSKSSRDSVDISREALDAAIKLAETPLRVKPLIDISRALLDRVDELEEVMRALMIHDVAADVREKSPHHCVELQDAFRCMELNHPWLKPKLDD